jgi:hypothetical protein
MIVSVLQESGVYLHLALEHRLDLVRHLVPGGNLGMARGQVAVRRDDAQRFLTGEGDLALTVPTVGELALVLVGPFLRHVVRGVGRARREVGEEGLVGHQRLLLANPVDGVVGQVLGQVVAFFGSRGRLDGRQPFVERRIPLVVLAADEAIEVFEAAAAGRPVLERPHGAGLPDRHLVALAEHGGGIAVEFQGQGEGRLGVGA